MIEWMNESELFQSVISCKIVSSEKFKLVHKISVIQEKFLIIFNLLRGPDKNPPGLCIPYLHCQLHLARA